MLRRTTTRVSDALQEPRYEADLTKLGFMLNIDEIIRDGSDGEYFDFHHTHNMRANVLRKEAMHECVRDIVTEQLKRFDIGEVYLHDDKVLPEKPESAHLSILATNASTLSTRRHVVVVVGEHSQDLGIWSWRLLMNKHGLISGGALGLAAILQAYGLSQRSDLEENMENKTGPLPSYRINWAHDGVEDEDHTMGVIILNPGQLCYSPSNNRCMTHTTWQARRREHALMDEFEIDEKHNRVPGHASPEQHIRTFFESILRQLVHEDAHIYVVGIADGADYLLEYINKTITADPKSAIAHHLKALALIQPQCNPQTITVEILRAFLNDPAAARAWVMSEEPRGTLIKKMADPLPIRVSSPDGEDELTPTPLDMPTPTQRTFAGSPPPSPPGSVEAFPTPADDEDDNDFDYSQDPAICTTYSSGEASILENVWPQAMNEALTFFFEVQRNVDDWERSG